MIGRLSPSPWSVARQYETCADVEDSDGLEVAEVTTVNGSANARLVAAAPEMYALLTFFAAGFIDADGSKSVEASRLLSRIDGGGK